MFKNYGMNITSIFRSAEEERYELRHPYVGTEHLLLSILRNDEEMINFLKRYNLTYDNFKKELIMVVGSASKYSDVNLYTPMLKKVINNAIENAKENNNNLTIKHLILSMLEEGEGIAIRLLVGMGIDIDSLYEDLNNENKISKKKLEIFETGILLNENIDFEEKVIGRDKEIDLIIETLLRKKKNNPILIGDAGVGKTAIVEELVRRIERKEVPESLYNTKIVSLEMGALVSGTKYRGEFEEKLTKIIKELENDNKIILFIDEIHSMVNAGGAEGAITAGDIFKPALARGNIKCIGATTNYEYNKFFSNDKALMRRFEVINVDEPNQDETKDILLKIKGEYEQHHNVKINDNAIEKILLYTNKFITNKKNPDKSIDFLDSVCSKVKTDNNYSLEKKKLYNKLDDLKKKKEKCVKSNNYDEALHLYNEEIKINKRIKNTNNNKKKLEVTEEYIIRVLENKTNMLFSEEKLSLLENIKNNINDKLYGINKEVDSIIDLIKSKIINKEGFLKVYLEGEEYLGKSSLVKTIAESFPKCNFLRIDLNEYKNYSDINKLIGTTQGYVGYNDEHIFSKLKNNFTIILFDNYNKCHENVKELIKEILKEKYITDNRGEKIYFNNCFIFITNDVYKKINVGFNNEINDVDDNELIDLVDGYIKFAKLTKDKLEGYLDKFSVKDKNKIIKESNYEKYNYKNINKLIEKEKLLNVIVQ